MNKEVSAIACYQNIHLVCKKILRNATELRGVIDSSESNIDDHFKKKVKK